MLTIEATRITVTITEHTDEIPQGLARDAAIRYALGIGIGWKVVSAHWNNHRWNIILSRDTNTPVRNGKDVQAISRAVDRIRQKGTSDGQILNSIKLRSSVQTHNMGL